MPLYSQTASLHILPAELRVEVYVRRTGLLNKSVLSTLVLATALPGFAGLIAHSSAGDPSANPQRQGDHCRVDLEMIREKVCIDAQYVPTTTGGITTPRFRSRGKFHVFATAHFLARLRPPRFEVTSLWSLSACFHFAKDCTARRVTHDHGFSAVVYLLIVAHVLLSA